MVMTRYLFDEGVPVEIVAHFRRLNPDCDVRHILESDLDRGMLDSKVVLRADVHQAVIVTINKADFKNQIHTGYGTQCGYITLREPKYGFDAAVTAQRISDVREPGGKFTVIEKAGNVTQTELARDLSLSPIEVGWDKLHRTIGARPPVTTGIVRGVQTRPITREDVPQTAVNDGARQPHMTNEHSVEGTHASAVENPATSRRQPSAAERLKQHQQKQQDRDHSRDSERER